MASHNTTISRGFSLVELMVVAAIMSFFFVGLFGGVKYTLALISDSRAKLTALTVANKEIEYVRSLAYDAVGTVSGIPAGAIPQVSTTTLNDIEFQKRVLIEYVDDDADGLGGADSNGITTDYKQVKVEVTWSSKGIAREVFLVSNIIPRSIETDVGGGTLRVNVFDSLVAPLPGASVRVINDTIVPNIDVTRNTDAMGIALFGGAPAGPDYEIFVTAPNYSSDQTHVATSTFNPTTQPVAVLEADISTMNFFIDELSELNIRTLADQEMRVITEPFSDTSGLATSTDVAVTSGSLQIADVGGIFAASGTFVLNSFTPTPIEQWRQVEVSGNVPADTTLVLHFYTGTSTLTLISDSDLPGNSAGFSIETIDLSALDALAFPSIILGGTFTTASSTVTPALDDITVLYLESETVRSNVALQIHGAKTIGTDGGLPVYKTTHSITTDGNGEYELSDLEWDAYTISSASYDIAEACPGHPTTVPAGTTVDVDLILVPNTANTLRVVVETAAGQPIEGADVTLSNGVFYEQLTTSACGQVFFNGLAVASDYDLLIEPSGYPTWSQNDITIENDELTVVQF